MIHTIWQNTAINIDDWADYLEEFYPFETDEYEKYRLIEEQNDGYLEDERVNLDVCVGTPILVIADLGLWNGRRIGYKEIESGNISDCLYSECEYCNWYCDNHNFRASMIHHDGTNNCLYRAWKPGLSEEQRDRFLEKLCTGKATSRDFTRYTRSLLPFIREVYGF